MAHVHVRVEGCAQPRAICGRRPRAVIWQVRPCVSCFQALPAVVAGRQELGARWWRHALGGRTITGNADHICGQCRRRRRTQSFAVSVVYSLFQRDVRHTPRAAAQEDECASARIGARSRERRAPLRHACPQANAGGRIYTNWWYGSPHAMSPLCRPHRPHAGPAFAKCDCQVRVRASRSCVATMRKCIRDKSASYA